MKIDLPAPSCEIGYTVTDLNKILGVGTPIRRQFSRWLYGQTLGICPEHEGVTYPWDLQRFLKGLPVID